MWIFIISLIFVIMIPLIVSFFSYKNILLLWIIPVFYLMTGALLWILAFNNMLSFDVVLNIFFIAPIVIFFGVLCIIVTVIRYISKMKKR